MVTLFQAQLGQGRLSTLSHPPYAESADVHERVPAGAAPGVLRDDDRHGRARAEPGAAAGRARAAVREEEEEEEEAAFPRQPRMVSRGICAVLAPRKLRDSSRIHES